MAIFALVHIEELLGVVRFYKLVVDNRCPFDEFEEAIRKEGNLAAQLNSIQTRLQMVANRHSLPATKFKPLAGCKDPYTEYEIKTKDLRIYLFKDPKTGNIIVCGGKKSTQRQDINHFRTLKKQYINSKTG